MDADRSLVRVFDVNERVKEVKKELLGMKQIKKRMRKMEEKIDLLLESDHQKRAAEPQQDAFKEPQPAEPQVSQIEKAVTAAQMSITHP